MRFVLSRSHHVEIGRRKENKSLRASMLGRDSHHPAAALARNGESACSFHPGINGSPML